jgi:glutathione S-transferase
MDIVLHLDEIYPEKPAFPSIEGSTREQTIALAQKVQDLFVKCRTDGHLGQIAMPHIPGILDEPGSEYFIRTRSSMPPFHKSPLDWASEDPEDDWKHFEPSLKPIADVLSEKPGPFCLGETFSYADAIILGQLGWMESCDQKYLERICKMHGGAFGRIWDKAMKEGWVEGQGEDKEWPLK